eukprot:gene21286-28210_t
MLNLTPCGHLLYAIGHSSSDQKIWESLDADPRVESFLLSPNFQAYRLVSRKSGKDTSHKGTVGNDAKESKVSEVRAFEEFLAQDSENSEKYKEPKPESSESEPIEYEMTMLQSHSTGRKLKPLPPGTLGAQDTPAGVNTGRDSDATDDDVESILCAMPVSVSDATDDDVESILCAMPVRCNACQMLIQAVTAMPRMMMLRASCLRSLSGAVPERNMVPKRPCALASCVVTTDADTGCDRDRRSAPDDDVESISSAMRVKCDA